VETMTPEGRAIIVESASELPDLRGARTAFVDVETTSFSDTEKALNPWRGHRVAGVAVTVDDDPRAWYAPMRHRLGPNLPVDAVTRWTRDILNTCSEWANHNVKFDAHFLEADGVTTTCGLSDTVVLAKMIDSDARTHSLKPICRDWLKMDMGEEVRLRAWLRGAKTEDYGAAPSDLVGEYACMDVLANRKLYRWLLERLPEDQRDLWQTERALTRVLLGMERRGMQIDERACRIEQVTSLRRMVDCADRIREATGVELVNSSQCMHEILCVQLGLPILARTDGGGPSFDKEALKLYAGHPEVVTDEEALAVLETLLEFRTESQFKGLFADSFLDKAVDGVLHPSYNQLVRTGRMSCSDPNSQQFNKRAKRLITPRGAFFSSDASQIEFRVIAHYIRDEDVIAAYAEDRRTDFHQWVADLCGIDRSPAKTINFAMAYGAGKKRITQELSGNKKIMEEVGSAIDADETVRAEDRAREYARRCELRAAEIYRDYHERLPGLKGTAERATDATRRRGWVRNLFGRRRHLPLVGAHKAFNSLVQGCAMDIIKRKMVELDDWLDGAHLVANVHDEVLIEGPPEMIEDAAWQEHVLGILRAPVEGLRVPIEWDRGTSRRSWADAGE
jgi:DNA polymerase-1